MIIKEMPKWSLGPLEERAAAWAARNVALWLRAYARAEMTMSEGLKPSMTSDTVALICRNLADTIERDTDLLQVMLLTAEQQVIAAARSENLTMIRDAISNLNDAQDAVDNARRSKTIRRLSDPPVST